MIEDVRLPEEFRTFTFSGFKKTQVRDELILSLLSCRIEEACYWSAELICAGHFVDLWDIFFYFVGKHIHLGNPLVAIYIRNKYLMFRAILLNEVVQYIFDLRNNLTIRELFSEIVATLALSEKKQSWEEIKIVEVQDISQMTSHLRADGVQYIDGVLHENDPREWMIPLNELGYHLIRSKNMNLACFWIEWMAEFDALCKRNRTPLFCERRMDYAELENKYRGDYIWPVWETMLHAMKVVDNPVAGILLQTLFDLFRVKYTSGAFRKRKPLIYFAVSLFTETAVLKREILNEREKQMVAMTKRLVNSVTYKVVKQNEVGQHRAAVADDEDGGGGDKRRKNIQRSLQQMESLRAADFAEW